MLRTALLTACLALPAVAQAPASAPANPCAAPAPDGKLSLQFFACLDNKRGQCETFLQEVYSDCGPASARYKSAYFAYDKLKGASNALLNTLILDLRSGTKKDKIDEAVYAALLQDLRARSEAFDELAAAKVNCANQPDTQRAAPLVIMVLGVLKDSLLSNLRSRTESWLAGDEAKRNARAKDLEGQRWKNPLDLQMPVPAPPKG
ncbi:MAG TPA: hypothetical protein VJ623_01205 [Holophagaceae bacterium]|nr:hypothetical protein [Holophagaceae bacterium]